MFHRHNLFITLIGASSGIVLTALLIIVGGARGFIALADEVSECDTQNFDVRVVKALRTPDPNPLPEKAPDLPIGPNWLHEVGRDLTGLGGIAVLTLLVAAVAGYLILVRKYHAMWLVLA